MPERFSSNRLRAKGSSAVVSLHLYGKGITNIQTSVGFFDHMLMLMARHGLLDLTAKLESDPQEDDHHIIEDVGCSLGLALAEALGDKKGITRYGSFLLPMDEALVQVAIDLSGRAHLEYHVDLATKRVGAFDTCLVKTFLNAFARNAELSLHVDLLRGIDPHHIIEAVFKGVGRALRIAVAQDDRESGIPTSKGVLGNQASRNT